MMPNLGNGDGENITSKIQNQTLNLPRPDTLNISHDYSRQIVKTRPDELGNTGI